MRLNLRRIYIILTFVTLALNLNSNTTSENWESRHLQITKLISYNKPNTIDIEKQIKGYYCKTEDIFGIVCDNDTIGIVEISSPSIVAIADKEYPWGWFQFPILGMNEEGIIIVKWQMMDDSADAYGNKNASNCYRISTDKGMSWEIPAENYTIPAYRGMVTLPNGDILSCKMYAPKDSTYKKYLPLPIFTEGEKTFFLEKDLPEEFQGVYENYFKKDSKVSIHAKIRNENLVRYSVRGKLATFWFGKLLRNGTDLYAGVYPSYYTDDNGILKPGSISFYKSEDVGLSWDLQGIIDYQVEEQFHPQNISFNKKGFSEPTFEILKDGSFLCIMRTSLGFTAPMYKSYSYDNGKKWTTPVPITPNGVMPQLIRLDNDILLLASGRPGIQVRISYDGKGEKWSSPIELIDYDESKKWINNTCGYPFLFKVSENEAFIVYSDFKTMDDDGNYRKSIIFRKLKIYKL